MCLTMPPFILGEDLWPRGSPFGLGLLSCVPMLQCWASSWMGPPVAGEPSAVLLMCCVVFPPDPASGAALGSSLEQIKLPAGNNQFSPFILPASAITLRSSSPPGGDGRAGPSLSQCVATSSTIPRVPGPDGWSSIFTRAGAGPACLPHSLWKTRVPGPAASLRGAAVSTGEDLGSLHLFGLQERRMRVAFQQTVALPAVLDPTSFLWAWS